MAKQFKEKYEAEAEKYLPKNMTELMESKPGQAYNVLKKMGAQPGDCIDYLAMKVKVSLSNSLQSELLIILLRSARNFLLWIIICCPHVFKQNWTV